MHEGFIKVNSKEAVIQVGSNYKIGPNGVGGVTADGDITKWELTENRKKEYFSLHFNVITNIGNYDIKMSLNADGSATALKATPKTVALKIRK